MEFLKLAADRYSCRMLTDQKVEPELLNKIIEAGRLAPTAVNRQPVKIWVMQTPEAREGVAQCTTCTFGAGTFLVVGGKQEDAWVRAFDNRNFDDVDDAIVATHMLMEMQDLGLATTWVGWFDAPKLKSLCPQMENYDLIAIFPVGYADEKAGPAPRHSQRKSREELVEIL